MNASINIKDLKTLLQMVIDLMQKNERVEYNFKFDEYWVITHTDWLNFQRLPEPGVGSLNDDIHYLQKAIEDKSRFSFIDFDRIAVILKAISGIEAPC